MFTEWPRLVYLIIGEANIQILAACRRMRHLDSYQTLVVQIYFKFQPAETSCTCQWTLEIFRYMCIDTNNQEY